MGRSHTRRRKRARKFTDGKWSLRRAMRTLKRNHGSVIAFDYGRCEGDLTGWTVAKTDKRGYVYILDAGAYKDNQ